MGEFLRDLRYAARLYRRSPGFATVTVLLIALGIAANAVIFSAFDALLLRPLPVSHPEELVRPVHFQPGLGPRSSFFYSFYTAIKDRAEMFSGILGQAEMNLAIGDSTTSERIWAHFVTGNFFSVLGAPPLYGRAL